MMIVRSTKIVESKSVCMLGEKKEWHTVGELGKCHMWFHSGTPNTH